MHRHQMKYVATVLVVLLIFALAASATPRERVWVLTPLEAGEDAYGTFGNDITDRGTIGGGWVDEDGGYHAAYWHRGAYYDLEDEIGVPVDKEGGNSIVMSINNGGLMGGVAMNDDGRVAVLWDIVQETVTDMHPSGYLDSAIWGVNSRGSACGIAEVLKTIPSGAEIPLPQPYLWPKNADDMALPIGESLGGRARGINARGAVAGSFFSPIGWVQACVWIPGARDEYELVDLHAELDDDTIVASEAYDVKENGVVIGMGYGFDDEFNVFTYAWTWTEADGFTILDDDDVGAAIGWKANGVYIAGSTGLLGNTPDATAAVWVRGVLEVLPEPEDMPQSECASVSRRGEAVGYGFAEDDVDLLYPQGWVARKE